MCVVSLSSCCPCLFWFASVEGLVSFFPYPNKALSLSFSLAQSLSLPHSLSSLSLFSDKKDHNEPDDGHDGGCDAWAAKAFHSIPTPNCSNARGLIDMAVTRHGCCGEPKQLQQSACYVDISGAVCKDKSKCELYRCRLAGVSVFFPFPFFHYFSLSFLSYYALSSVLTHTHTVSIFPLGYYVSHLSLSLSLSSFFLFLRQRKPLDYGWQIFM